MIINNNLHLPASKGCRGTCYKTLFSKIIFPKFVSEFQIINKHYTIMKKDVYLNFAKMFWSALFLLLGTIFISTAIYQLSQGDWMTSLICIVAPLPFFILILIIRKREFTTTLRRTGWGNLNLEFRFNYAGMWFGLFQWIFLGIHQRSKMIFQTKVYSGNYTRIPIHRRFRDSHHGYSSSGIYSEDTLRTTYTDWRDSYTYYSIKGKRLYIRASLPDKYVIHMHL
jgi:hypothetical protein